MPTRPAGAHAIAIVTEWDEFKTLDYSEDFCGHAETGLSLRRAQHRDLDALAERRIQRERHRQAAWSGRGGGAPGVSSGVVALTEAERRLGP